MFSTPIITENGHRNPKTQHDFSHQHKTPDFGAVAAALGLPYLHQRPDGSWAVPSDSTPGVEHTVHLTGDPRCSCPEGIRALVARRRPTCWHLPVAAARAQTPALAAPVRQVVMPASFDALVAELYGPRAA